MLQEQELTYRIRGCVFEVFKQLGHGFAEKVYEHALMAEFILQGIHARNQVHLPVTYKGTSVGDYFADIIVENRVVLELKAQTQISAIHETQLLNYLRAGNYRIGMLINFTYPKAVIKRLII
ncbi:MAG: GxxExxY protein [Pseudomonadota bacterium]